MSDDNKQNPNIINNIPNSIDNAIYNLTDKLTQSMGQTFSDIWNLVFGRSHFTYEKKKIKYEHDLEQYRQEISSSVANIPPENRIEPSVQIVAQALNNSRYCIEEKELREMFVALITKSMNSEYSNRVHPSFSSIINQMSVLDAKILQLFRKAETERNLASFPICQYYFILNEKNPLERTTVPEHIFLDMPNTDIILCSQSLSSLERFGIVSLSYNTIINTPNIYDKFLDTSFYCELKASFPPDIKFGISKGAAILTPLGRSFVNICVPTE